MKQSYLLTDCQNLRFSPSLSQNRLQRAVQVLGEPILRRVLCYSLYLLGVNRSEIGQTLAIPPETAKTIIKSVKKKGLAAFEDQRYRNSSFLPPVQTSPDPVTLSVTKEHVIVDFGVEGRCLHIPRENSLQVRTVLFTLCNSGLLSYKQVAQAIGLTPVYTAKLARQLADEDVLSLIDKREGQKSDYRITPDVKAELVQQFAVDVIARGKTSGRTISEEIEERCQLTVPPRTVRHHMAGMGLAKIKQSLPKLVDAVKKTSKRSS